MLTLSTCTEASEKLRYDCYMYIRTCTYVPSISLGSLCIEAHWMHTVTTKATRTQLIFLHLLTSSFLVLIIFLCNLPNEQSRSVGPFILSVHALMEPLICSIISTESNVKVHNLFCYL